MRPCSGALVDLEKGEMGGVSISAADDGGDPPARGRSDGLRDHSGESQDVHRGLRRSHRGGRGRGWRGHCGGGHRRRAPRWIRRQHARSARQAHGRRGAAEGPRVRPDGHARRLEQLRQRTLRDDHADQDVPVRRHVLPRVSERRHHRWQARQGVGTACRQPDGSWKVQG